MIKQMSLFNGDEAFCINNINFDFYPVSVFDENKIEAIEIKRHWRQLYSVRSDFVDVGRKIKKGCLGGLEIYKKNSFNHSISIFSEALAYFLVNCFFDKNGSVLDPFAGGPARGLICSAHGLDYTGIDISFSQIKYNLDICKSAIDNFFIQKIPEYICGDSMQKSENLTLSYDYLFTCPPYANLEVYSDNPLDLSNMDIEDFKKKYQKIIVNLTKKIKKRMIFVVGNTKNCNLYNLTCEAAEQGGFFLKQEVIRVSPTGPKAIGFKRLKNAKNVVKIHEYCLIFDKK